ncbi:DUF6928 family protein [Streptomyces hirsutus]|uniref:DUF6928 family protein n=1 Tax=Streptomyces hirsutus TaxID=35620 RepID=UPI003F4C1760
MGAADLDRTAAMMRRLHPGPEIEQCEGSNLWDGAYPPKGTAYTAGRPGVEVIGDQEVMIDAPSEPPEHWVAASAGRRLAPARHAQRRRRGEPVMGLTGVDPDPEVGRLLGHVRLLDSGSMPFGPRNTRRQLRKQRSIAQISISGQASRRAGRPLHRSHLGKRL